MLSLSPCLYLLTFVELIPDLYQAFNILLPIIVFSIFLLPFWRLALEYQKRRRVYRRYLRGATMTQLDIGDYDDTASNVYPSPTPVPRDVELIGSKSSMNCSPGMKFPEPLPSLGQDPELSAAGTQEIFPNNRDGVVTNLDETVL